MGTIKPIPEGWNCITPYLAVRNAKAAIAFYQKAFGAKEIGRLIMPGDNVGHAELQIGDSHIMLSEEMPEWGNKSPATLGATTVAMVLYVANADTTFQQALDAGATAVSPVKDEFYGDRSGVVLDPFGHKWHINTHIEDVSFDEMQQRCDAMMPAAK